MYDRINMIYIGFIGFMILFLLAGLSVTIINTIGATEGEHTGYISAVEHNSNIIWDADLAYFKTSAESTQEDIYCINKELVRQAKDISSKGKRVTITFKNDFLVWKSECNGGISIIKEIKEEIIP